MRKRKYLMMILLLLGFSLSYLRFANFHTDEVIVAIIDTGVNRSEINHPYMLDGFDFVDFDYLPNDENGHGTLMHSTSPLINSSY